MPPPTQNTLHPAMFSSPSLMLRGGGRGVGLAARNVNRGDRRSVSAVSVYATYATYAAYQVARPNATP